MRRRRRSPPVLFVYVVLFPDTAARERVVAAFEREGIGSNRYLPSIHLQPYMRERFGFEEGCARSPRTSAPARSRCRSSRGSRPLRRSASPRFSPQPSETAPTRLSQSTQRAFVEGASVPSGRFRPWSACGTTTTGRLRRPGRDARLDGGDRVALAVEGQGRRADGGEDRAGLEADQREPAPLHLVVERRRGRRVTGNHGSPAAAARSGARPSSRAQASSCSRSAAARSTIAGPYPEPSRLCRST